MDAPGANKIARKIHDGIAQDLVAFGYSLDQALGAPDLPISTRAELRQLRFDVTKLIGKVRREILDLRELGSDLNEIVNSLCGDRMGELELQVELASSLHPIVVELIRNAAKHAGASLINLRTFYNDAYLVIEVSDNGIGFSEKMAGFGFKGISEQVEILAGKLEFEHLSAGMLVRVSIPK